MKYHCNACDRTFSEADADYRDHYEPFGPDDQRCWSSIVVCPFCNSADDLEEQK